MERLIVWMFDVVLNVYDLLFTTPRKKIVYPTIEKAPVFVVGNLILQNRSFLKHHFAVNGDVLNSTHVLEVLPVLNNTLQARCVCWPMAMPPSPKPRA